MSIVNDVDIEFIIFIKRKELKINEFFLYFIYLNYSFVITNLDPKIGAKSLKP